MIIYCPWSHCVHRAQRNRNEDSHTTSNSGITSNNTPVQRPFGEDRYIQFSVSNQAGNTLLIRLSYVLAWRCLHVTTCPSAVKLEISNTQPIAHGLMCEELKGRRVVFERFLLSLGTDRKSSGCPMYSGPSRHSSRGWLTQFKLTHLSRCTRR